MITQSMSKLVPIITNSESHASMRLKNLIENIRICYNLTCWYSIWIEFKDSTLNTLHIHTNANHNTILDEFTLFWAKKPVYFSHLNNSSSIYVFSNLNFIKKIIEKRFSQLIFPKKKHSASFLHERVRSSRFPILKW